MKIARGFARRRARYWVASPNAWAARLARMHARHEAEVRAGKLAPEALHVIPVDWVREAHLQFPEMPANEYAEW